VSRIEKIVAEIRSLRKGRGVHAADLHDRVGPNLRELAGASSSDRDAPLRTALVSELVRCAAQLAPDLQTAILGALAISPDTRHLRSLDDRVVNLTVRLNYAERTIRRRIDHAEGLLAEVIADQLRQRGSRAPIAPTGWDLDEFATVLRLDRPVPEAYEQRRIVATSDDLREVVAWLDVPADDTVKLAPEMVYGGDLVRQASPARNRFHLVVRLPRPLRVGEEHRYGMIVRLAPGQPMRPHYIFTPECRCRIFTLQVTFDLDRPPQWVRRVDGEPVRLFDTAEPGDEDLLTMDEAGKVELVFHNPALYLGYGVQWRP
jgi:hypothetical protein